MNPQDKLQFPLFVDSTIMADIKACKTRAYWKYIRNKAAHGTSIHLIAGGAFAAGLEVTRREFFIKGAPFEDALCEGVKALWAEYGDPQDLGLDYNEHAKSPLRITGALDYYFERYPIDTDILRPAIINDNHCIEFSFSLELPVSHPETGEHILYCGRCDMISEYNGALIVVDEKTTSQLGQTWSSQWDLRSQFMGYTWAARQYGLPVTGAMVRGVAIRKTGYDSAQALVYFPEWMLNRWLEQTCKELEAFKACFLSSKYDLNYGGSCTEYGGCEMKKLCLIENPEPWVDLYYRDHTWNPLHRLKGTEMPLAATK